MLALETGNNVNVTDWSWNIYGMKKWFVNAKQNENINETRSTYSCYKYIYETGEKLDRNYSWFGRITEADIETAPV